MLNKRGQEGFTLPWLITIIVIVVVAIVVIFGTTGLFKKIFGASEAIPSRLEAVAQVCKAGAQIGGITAVDYCYTFKDVGGDHYVNCEDARIQDALRRQEITSTIQCDNRDLVNNAVANKCAELSSRKQKSAVFNNGALSGCSGASQTCAAQGGTKKQQQCDTELENTIPASDLDQGEFCCKRK